jgi:TonB family protein
MSISSQLANSHADAGMQAPVVWEQFVGRIVDGKFPLQKLIESSERSAIYFSERGADTSQKVAIKLTLADGFGGNEEEEAQLSRWADAAKLSHPHLIKLFESGRCKVGAVRLLYVVMEYAEENLAQILPQRALTTEEVTEMLPPTVDALSFLHQSGFVHGQIRPSNVMAIDNQIKISCDVLRRTDERSGQEVSAYDAPEVKSSGPSAAADIWSVGAMLVSVFTQHEPAPRDGRSSQVAIPEAVPEPFRTIAKKCLRIAPQQRGGLGDILSGLHPQETLPAAAIEQPQSLKRSRPWLAPAIIVVALLFALLLGRRLLHHDSSSSDQTQTVQAPPPASTNSSPAQSPAPPAENRNVRRQESGGEVLQQVLPEVSRGAQNTISGHVKVGVQVSVDANGSVSRASLLSAGPSRYFADQAVSAARRWKFSPPQVNGQPLPSEWNLRFEFGRKSTQVVPSQVKP